ncbi:MAG: chitin synthase-domain-containing protein [Olpidium bornovanus]|uniref:chitin synthase n=1 Tax=Olpidium bornovanus TaxID=278681 RepID=A0A8H8A175_9FUNG|nr:MAG: chitin synthase-domain-containing protein [Olpidium bornovanus]
MKAAWGSPSAGQIASCHANAVTAHRLLAIKDSRLKRQDVFYTWDNLTSSTSKGGKLFAYSGLVLDAARLDYLDGNIDKTDPKGIVARVQSGEFSGMDATYHLTRIDPAWGRCLADAIVVGALDASSVGCVISDIVLYISLLVIVGVVLARFFLAVFFGWFLSWRIGNFEHLTFEERRKREAEIEAWSEQNMALVAANGGVDSPAIGPLGQTSLDVTRTVFMLTNHLNRRRGSGSVYGMDRSSSPYADNRRSFLPSTSRFSPAPPPLAQYRAGSTHSAEAAYTATGIGSTPPASPGTNPRFAGDGVRRGSEATGRASLPASNQGSTFTGGGLPPPPALTPFNFQLVHTIMLVTCYSEDTAGLRSSFDSLCTTDYPNTHKMLLVICDGIVMGSGNSASTPDICLSMLEDETVLREHVMPHSYVAIADGSRRHNMAKVYAGFYKYDDRFVPRDKQQRVPMVVVVKCGPQDEARAAKPGNRGKRDSQVLLMSFLQKVMFDERMTTLEYEFFNAIWGVTGVTPDQFEIVLMIDADTKIYPDALTRMVAVMVRDPNVMGLCGETKIANKSDSWVTAIQGEGHANPKLC